MTTPRTVTSQNSHQNSGNQREAEAVQCEEGDVGAYHDDITVSEIQHLGNAVDHCVSKGNDCVYASEPQAGYQIGQKSHC